MTEESAYCKGYNQGYTKGFEQGKEFQEQKDTAEFQDDLAEIWEYISKGKSGSKIFEFIEKKEKKWEAHDV